MLNKVILIGRLTKDPDLRFTSNGTAIATFTLAVDRPYTNQSGEKETDFINIVVWRKAAENTATYLKKGSLAAVDGRIQVRHYENDEGRRVYVTEVVAERVRFLGGGNGSKNSNDELSGDPFEGEPMEFEDDDLPF